MITQADELAALLARVEKGDRVALDTEADSLHCYAEKLCLLQFTIGEDDYLVDPLSGLDLEPMFTVLKKQVVIMHGADYDLRLLKRYGSFEPAELIDTMLAARLIGEEQLGLAALIEKYFGIKLCKASQRANWAMRPLSAQMLEYAVNDTRHLLKLADILLEKIDILGRREWLRESVERLQKVTRDSKEPSEQTDRWKISGSGKLNPRGRAILRVLWHWRDGEAREWDRPPFYVLGNRDLIDICSKADKGEKIDPRINGARRRRFFDALEKALAVPQSEWPVIVRKPRIRPPQEKLRAFDSLRSKRDHVAAKVKLEGSVIASKAALETFIFQEDDSLLMTWQKNLLGI
ncbi:MAG: ribonuclease D [Chthoniobacterales bacterium]